MISYVVGELAYKSAPTVIVQAGGLGYEISASLSTFASLPAIGSEVRLLTHFVVREDAQLLFGFADENERKLFRALIKVSGVGPKLALAILSGMDVAGFSRCIAANDIKSLTQLPGVGKKTAERLVIEMKDRLAEWSQAEIGTLGAEQASDVAPSQSVLVAEAETALIALGYKPTEASKAVAKVVIDDVDSSEALIRAALKAMLKR